MPGRYLQGQLVAPHVHQGPAMDHGQNNPAIGKILEG